MKKIFSIIYLVILVVILTTTSFTVVYAEDQIESATEETILEYQEDGAEEFPPAENPMSSESAEVIQKYYTATIKEITQKTDPQTQELGKVKTLTLEITSGDKEGQEVQSSWISASAEEEKIFSLENGEKVIVQYTSVNGEENYSVIDKQRINTLVWFLIILIVVLLVISRGYGLKSLLTLILTTVVIFYFLIPQIITGRDPLLISILAVGFFIIPSLFFSHGLNKKTAIAVVGIIFSIIVVALLAKLAIVLARFTGINTEETLYVNMYGGQKINLLNLLLAGMVLGTAGAMDDIALTQSSVVLELRRSNKKLSWQELFKTAMRVGNDHITSVTNTLFLAYFATSLPLVLLLTQMKIPFFVAIQREYVSTEILRILIGTIGLVLTVPLTTIIAAMIFSKNKAESLSADHIHQHHHNHHSFWKDK